MSTVDVAVVGRGLIGSAAARHLAEAGLAVALVGPAEPGDRQSSPGPFSSHADEGRITRICDESPVWSSLAARSIRRYPDIEARSQIPFHDGRGLLVSTPSLEEWIDAGLVMGATVKKVDRDWVLDQTGIRLPSDAPAAYESPPAGLINPRKLVAAQTSLAARAGAVVITDAVNELGPGPDGFVISGQWGSLDARQVLVATGAFGRHLYRDQLELERRPRTVLLAEMVPTGALPSLILGPPPDSRLDSLYWVPPVRYPDGRVYLKIGGSLAANPLLDDDEELVEWFHGDGDPRRGRRAPIVPGHPPARHDDPVDDDDPVRHHRYPVRTSVDRVDRRRRGGRRRGQRGGRPSRPTSSVVWQRRCSSATIQPTIPIRRSSPRHCGAARLPPSTPPERELIVDPPSPVGEATQPASEPHRCPPAADRDGDAHPPRSSRSSAPGVGRRHLCCTRRPTSTSAVRPVVARSRSPGRSAGSFPAAGPPGPGSTLSALVSAAVAVSMVAPAASAETIGPDRCDPTISTCVTAGPVADYTGPVSSANAPLHRGRLSAAPRP